MQKKQSLLIVTSPGFRSSRVFNAKPDTYKQMLILQKTSSESISALLSPQFCLL